MFGIKEAFQKQDIQQRIMYNHALDGNLEPDFRNKNKRAAVVNPVDLNDPSHKDKLNNLIGAKNQDQRFYGWLHLAPLFDDDSDDQGARKKKYQSKGRKRRGSEQIQIGNKENLMEFNSEDEEDVDIDQFCELYAGISYMFEIAEDEHDNNESEKKKKEDITEEPYGFLTQI